MKLATALAGLAVVAACAPLRQNDHAPAWVSDTTSYGPAIAPSPTIADRYREVAATIIAAAKADRGAYAKLAHLTDRIGNRLAGSEGLVKAIAWSAQAMAADGLVVRTEKVMVPHWVRGVEDAALVAPVARPLPVLALGGSVSTPKGGLTANVVVVRDWAELEARAAEVKGAIVLYDVAMPAWTPEQGHAGYGVAVPYRSRGPSRAAKLGAVAVLMRSVTPHSLHTLHTGALSYDPAQPKIPAAAVTVEDSQLIARLAKDGPVQIRLRLESQQLPDVESANVIGELTGREKPEEIVVIGGHIDSWDVGQGAHDDGAGCVTMMQAAALLKQLNLIPRRTIRVVLFTNEENGIRGAKAYAADHAAEMPRHVAAIESDGGGFSPRGFIMAARADVAPRAKKRLADLLSLLRPLESERLIVGDWSGTDVLPMMPFGVPTFELLSANQTYFDVHHTAADTLDKVDPAELSEAVAAMAVFAYVLADMPDRLDTPFPGEPPVAVPPPPPQTPEPASNEPTKPAPATPEPAKPAKPATSAPATPEPATPAKPAPARPEPATPAKPAKPEPATPAKPAPATPEPAKPAPATPEPAKPATSAPATPEPAKPPVKTGPPKRP
ncbi:MAG: M20/M25/M40 family metallo-hydrolase [Myxococcales bacterium]|nr:M20/M25/M40 family metallo-hydrolase [Myxococcales bacterium]